MEAMESINLRIARSSGIIAIAILLTKPISLLKEIIVAAKFGTSAELDAYFVSLVLPVLLGGIIVGSIQASLIPVLSEYKVKGNTGEGAKVFSSTLNLGLLMLLVATVLLLVLREYLVLLVAPGFDAHTLKIAVHLSLYSFSTLVFLGMNGFLAATLNTYERFFSPIIVQVAIPISIMGFVWWGYDHYGIVSLAVGNLVGAALAGVLLFFVIRRIGIQYSLALDWHHVNVQRTYKLLAPMLIGASLANANIMIDRIMASTLPAGSISALAYANKLIQLIESLLIISVSTAILPYFSQQVAQKDFNGLKDTFNKSIGMMAFLLLPITAMIVVLARPGIAILFQRGQFSAESTYMVAQALIFYSLGLFLIGVGFILPRVFNALGDNVTLMKLAFLSMGLNAALNYVLMKLLGSAGIALSTSLTYTIISILMLFFLKLRLGILHLRKAFASFPKIFTLSFIVSVVTYSLAHLKFLLSPLLGISLATALGIMLYILLAMLWKVPEVYFMRRILWNIKQGFER